MVKKNDGIKESTDSSNTIEDDGKYVGYCLYIKIKKYDLLNVKEKENKG